MHSQSQYMVVHEVGFLLLIGCCCNKYTKDQAHTKMQTLLSAELQLFFDYALSINLDCFLD